MFNLIEIIKLLNRILMLLIKASIKIIEIVVRLVNNKAINEDEIEVGILDKSGCFSRRPQ